MNAEQRQALERVFEAQRGARTLAEIDDAGRIMREHVARYPDDRNAVLWGGEMLEMKRTSIELYGGANDETEAR